jgi:hypothetical protein
MLHWNQVWKHMHGKTGVHIEKRAVMEFIRYFEEQMNMVISQSAKELKKRNSLNGVQGLRPRQRIDHKCVREAIKIINNNGHSSPSKRTGGKIKKESKREKHSQENTEVV